MLRRSLDERVGAKNSVVSSNALIANELRYGWLHDADAEIIDEVMLACPAPTMRILMTHGGQAIRGAVETYFERCGFTRTDASVVEATCQDGVIDTLLANCLTEGQVAALLEARQAGGKGKQLHPNILMTHRVVLAGAPNVGKSSIMNMLSGYQRAFVHEEAGATRDVVDELVALAGYAVLLGDLPGFSPLDTGLARESWLRARKWLGLAEMVWFVCDGSTAWTGETAAAAEAIASAMAERETPCPIVVVINKSDQPAGFAGEPWRDLFPEAMVVHVCSLPGGNARSSLERVVGALFSEDRP